MTEHACPGEKRFHAHRVIRAMTKSAAGMRIRPEGFALVCAIAMQEDSARYRHPVNFWSEQLMGIIGIRSRTTLIKIIRLCVKDGWLDYKSGNRGQPAVFSSKIPEKYEMLGDEITAEIKAENGICPICGQQRDGSRTDREQNVCPNVDTSSPIPIPKPSTPPSPPTGGSDSAGKGKQKRKRGRPRKSDREKYEEQIKVLHADMVAHKQLDPGYLIDPFRESILKLIAQDFTLPQVAKAWEDYLWIHAYHYSEDWKKRFTQQFHKVMTPGNVEQLLEMSETAKKDQRLQYIQSTAKGREAYERGSIKV